MDLLVALQMGTGFTSASFKLRHLPRQYREDMAFLLHTGRPADQLNPLTSPAETKRTI